MLELAKVKANVNGILRTLMEFFSAPSKRAHFLLLVMLWVLLKARLEPTGLGNCSPWQEASEACLMHSPPPMWPGCPGGRAHLCSPGAGRQDGTGLT